MKKSYDKFERIIYDTKSSNSTYSYVCRVVKPPYDYSDLLRWQWAQVISAIDKLVHDLIRIGMLQIYQGKRPSTPKFISFSITLDILLEIKLNPSQELQIIEKQIILANGYKSYQHPDKIAEGLSLIWNESQKWDKISKNIGQDVHTVKTFLKNAVIRRNQIVHEGDYDGYSLDRQPIYESDTNEVVEFIEKLGKSIYNCLI